MINEYGEGQEEQAVEEWLSDSANQDLVDKEVVPVAGPLAVFLVQSVEVNLQRGEVYLTPVVGKVAEDLLRGAGFQLE